MYRFSLGRFLTFLHSWPGSVSSEPPRRVEPVLLRWRQSGCKAGSNASSGCTTDCWGLHPM